MSETVARAVNRLIWAEGATEKNEAALAIGDAVTEALRAAERRAYERAAEVARTHHVRVLDPWGEGYIAGRTQAASTILSLSEEETG